MSDQTPAPPPPPSGPLFETEAEVAPSRVDPGAADGGSDTKRSDAETTKKRKDRVEFIAAFLIAIAAVLTAVATFQGSQVDGEVQQGQSDALRLTVLANDSFSNSNSERASERDLFFRAVTETDEEISDFLYDAMPLEVLDLVIEWGETDDAILNPFSSEANYAAIEGLYSTQLANEGGALDDDAYCAAFGAAVADSRGENYGLSSVFLAIALVVAGIAALLTSKVPQIMFLTISALSLLLGAGGWLVAEDQAEARAEQAAEFFLPDDLETGWSGEESLAAADALCGPA